MLRILTAGCASADFRCRFTVVALGSWAEQKQATVFHKLVCNSKDSNSIVIMALLLRKFGVIYCDFILTEKDAVRDHALHKTVARAGHI